MTEEETDSVVRSCQNHMAAVRTLVVASYEKTIEVKCLLSNDQPMLEEAYKKRTKSKRSSTVKSNQGNKGTASVSSSFANLISELVAIVADFEFIMVTFFDSDRTTVEFQRHEAVNRLTFEREPGLTPLGRNSVSDQTDVHNRQRGNARLCLFFLAAFGVFFFFIVYLNFVQRARA